MKVVCEVRKTFFVTNIFLKRLFLGFFVNFFIKKNNNKNEKVKAEIMPYPEQHISQNNLKSLKKLFIGHFSKMFFL